MRRTNHSLTFLFMALLMMLMTFASCSKLNDLLNEGDADDTRSTRVAARRHFNLISKCKFDGFNKKKIVQKLARLR